MSRRTQLAEWRKRVGDARPRRRFPSPQEFDDAAAQTGLDASAIVDGVFQNDVTFQGLVSVANAVGTSTILLDPVAGLSAATVTGTAGTALSDVRVTNTARHGPDNTTVRTSFFDATPVIPSNEATTGIKYHARIMGAIDNRSAGPADVLTIQCRVATSAALTFTVTPPVLTTQATMPFVLDWDLGIEAPGVTAKSRSVATLWENTTAANTMQSAVDDNVVTFDSTAGWNLDVTGQWNVADAANVALSRVAILERRRPL